LEARTGSITRTLAQEDLSGTVEVRTLPTGLLVDFCRDVGADAVVRGLRSPLDLAYEEPMARMNDHRAEIDTSFLLTVSAWSHISSSLVREVHALGGDVSDMLPGPSLDALRAAAAASWPTHVRTGSPPMTSENIPSTTLDTALRFDAVDLIGRTGSHRRVERTVPAPPREAGGIAMQVPEGQDIAVEAELESVVEGIYAHGTVTAHLEGECSRCLDPVDQDVTARLDELFMYPEKVRADEKEDTALLESDEVNL